MIDRKGMKLFFPFEKCCSNPELGREESWFYSGQKLLLLRVFRSSEGINTFNLKDHPGIRLEQTIETSKKSFTYMLRAAVCIGLDRFYSIVKNESVWTFMAQRMIEPIDPTVFLKINNDYLLFYELSED